MITVDKDNLVNLIKSFIRQGADDQINFGQILPIENYDEAIEFQLKQLEIILHDDLKEDCQCNMCEYYRDESNFVEPDYQEE